MVKTFITDAVISKGYNGADTFRYSETKATVYFRIGYRVYDKNATDNRRYVNIMIKAFNPICERIEKMQLRDGSHINLCGRLDEETWNEGNEKRSRFIIIADEIEYSGNNGKTNGNDSKPQQNGQDSIPQNSPQTTQEEHSGMPESFGGFLPPDEESPYFPGSNQS